MLLLLAGCTNTMTPRGGAPFALGGVRSALWMETGASSPDRGVGEAIVLLASDEIGCSTLADTLGEGTDAADSVLWSGSGVLLWLAFYVPSGDAADFAGDYYAGTYGASYGASDAPERTFAALAWSDGSIYQTSGLGITTVTGVDDDTAAGRARTDLVEVRFHAEVCPPATRGDDTGWTYTE
jgi:hypothetical protein